MADNKEIDVFTILDDGYERFTFFRGYNTSVKECGEGAATVRPCTKRRWS
ncbi:hypothetical protein ACE6JH_23525 [Streptomyces nigra]